MRLQPVNLLWQKRYRGVLPFVANSVTDEGHALVVRPDELEARTYQILLLSPSGQPREISAISVETVRKFEVVPDGSVLLGVTVDDIYLFRDGRKSRFMPDRRVGFSDVALARQGTLFTCAFSDMMFASHTVALGDVSGRLGWTRDVDAPVNRVALAADGRHLVVGRADGVVTALDHLRTAAWEYCQDAAVTGLALGHAGAPCAVGTEDGSVLLLDASGAVNWQTTLGLPVLAVAMDATGEWVLALSGDGGRGLLTCLGQGGLPLWEYDLEAQPTGAAVSPNGRFLGVTLSDGGLMLFEAEFSSAGAGAQDREQALAEVGALEGSGDIAGARDRLLRLLADHPGDAAAGGRLVELEDRLAAERLRAAREHAESGALNEALLTLREALRSQPYREDLFSELCATRRARVESLAAEAEARASVGSAEEALGLLEEVLRVDPLHLPARERLAALQSELAHRLMAEGDACEASGDQAGALERWRRAGALAENPELEARIRRAEVQHCMEAGVALYEQQRFAEASFQFKKCLALDPNHEEAQRYLQYTQGGGPDALITGRFHRLE